MTAPQKLPAPIRNIAGPLADLIMQYMQDALTEPRKRIDLLDHRMTSVEQRLEKEGLTRSQSRSIQKAAGKKAHEITKAISGSSKAQHFANIYGSLKDKYNVGSYLDIPRDKFTFALELIASYDGSGRNWWTD